jgi:hypothetical protein
MTIGQIARKIFGKHFNILGKIYRAIFVDLSVVAQSISPHIPQGATIVDVGGGDGEPLNYLLSLRHDIKVKLIDTSLCIGDAVKKEYLDRIELYPATSMGEFSIKINHKPDVILISDVIHHIANQARKKFFSELRTMVGDGKEVRIIVKDFEPGYFRSSLGFMADRYISGDNTVSLVGRADISYMMAEAFGNTISMEETNLFELDKPNYALIFVHN